MGRKIVLYALLIVGLSASFYVIGQRARVESRNKAVDIVLDYTEIEQIAASTGRTTEDVLSAFKKAGATRVAIPEQTVADMIDGALIMPASETTLNVRKDVSKRVSDYLQNALGDVSIAANEAGTHLSLIISKDVPLDYLRLLPIGLPESAIQAAKAADLQIVARLVNYPGATPKAIDFALKNAKAQGVSTIIFQGDQVLGFKGAVKYTAAALKANKLRLGWVEFSKQKGDAELARRSESNIVVVHSILQNEMPTLTLGSIVERFKRAVKERGVRMCYVRMYSTAGSDILKDNTAYVHSIASAIASTGFAIKTSHPLQAVQVTRTMRMVVGAGVAAGAVLLLVTIFDLSIASFIIWTIIMLAGCVGLAWIGDIGRKADALLAAAVFPTLAAIVAVRGTPNRPTHNPRVILRTLGRFILAIIMVAAGGAIVTGLLSERSFMLRTEQFAGIKLAFLIPIFALTAIFLGDIGWISDTYAAQKLIFRFRLRQIASNPILIWEAVGAFALLLVVSMMVLRSGNEPGVGVSDLELKIRALLDKLMVVRPRTKEFLIGYPALFAGIAFAIRGRREWAAPLVVIGSIGLTSALNTFCHIHTPLFVSGLRLVNGAIVGGIIGMILYWLIRDLPGRETKKHNP